MKQFVSSIRGAVENGNWFSALFLALAVPDVCGALENPNAAVGDRYKSWFNRYLKQKYDPTTLFDSLLITSPESLAALSIDDISRLKSTSVEAKSNFTADDCYRFRCKCLHQGLPEKMEGERIHFTAPDKLGRVIVHRCLFNGIYQMQIDIFCNDICQATEQWIQDVVQDSKIQNRMAQLIEIYDLDSPHLPIVKYEA